MTTNYGERPGIVLDGDANYWRGKVAEVERERDAAREDAARLRAALDELLSAIDAGEEGVDDVVRAKLSGRRPNYRAALAAFSEELQNPTHEARAALRATEAGKDGAL